MRFRLDPDVECQDQAIREGVPETLRITREHFAQLYDNVPDRFYRYDSGNLARVRRFVHRPEPVLSLSKDLSSPVLPCRRRLSDNDDIRIIGP